MCVCVPGRKWARIPLQGLEVISEEMIAYGLEGQPFARRGRQWSPNDVLVEELAC